MSEFNRKCGNVLTGGATGAAAGGSYFVCFLTKHIVDKTNQYLRRGAVLS